MSTLTITRGLPGSGKTTWAKAWVAEAPEARARVNRDDLRDMLYGTRHGLTFTQESVITEVSRAAVLALLKAGRDVVADDMNLRPKYAREWRRFARANGHEFAVHAVEATIEQAIGRDAGRDHSLGADTIRAIAGKYTRNGALLPIPDDAAGDARAAAYVAPPDAPLAVIVDIDGTLALHNGRSPYDLDRVGDDLPNAPVIAAVAHARAAGAHILYCSGREDTARDATRDWLTRHVAGSESDPLFMRRADDKRRDSIVKRELFDEHIRHDYAVAYVLDDRKQVVDMWRSLGLTVMQVAEGDF